MAGTTSTRYYWTPDQKQRMVDLYEETWSVQEIADSFHCNRETIRYHLKRSGVKLRKPGMQTPRARAKYSGANHKLWKGGLQSDHGYIRIYKRNHPRATKNGNVLEHRLVVEQHLAQTDPTHPAMGLDGTLRTDWIVHHRNGRKDDNRIENLEPRHRSEHHSWLHYQDEAKRLRGLLKAHGIEH